MASRHREVEARFEAPSECGLPDLTRLPGVVSVDGPIEHELEARYFDDADLSLTTAGITVRRRTGGDDEGWYVKIPSGKTKFEFHEPLGRATVTLPERLRTLLQAHVRDRRLMPVARVRTDRALYRLRDDHGRVLAEVCDVVVITEATRSEQTDRSWREWEVELVAADDDLLTAAGALLRRAGATPGRSSSKLAYALGHMPARPATGKMTCSRPAGTVVQARLTEQLQEMKHQDPLARADVPDALHQMRVAIRRLRSALATFRPLLDREVSEPLREELKWVASQLGITRDAEVARDRIAQLVDAEPDHLATGGLADHSRTAFESTHDEAHRQTVKVLESSRYLDLLDSLDAFVATPSWTGQAALPVKKVLPGRVRHEWKRVKSRMRDVDEAEAASDTENERLHEVRKASRRARYAAETAAPVYGDSAENFATAMEQLQRILGDHHDSLVLQARLLELASQPDDVLTAFGYGRLHARESQRAEQARSHYEQLRQTASKKKLRRWMR